MARILKATLTAHSRVFEGQTYHRGAEITVALSSPSALTLRQDPAWKCVETHGHDAPGGIPITAHEPRETAMRVVGVLRKSLMEVGAMLSELSPEARAIYETVSNDVGPLLAGLVPSGLTLQVPTPEPPRELSSAERVAEVTAWVEGLPRPQRKTTVIAIVSALLLLTDEDVLDVLLGSARAPAPTPPPAKAPPPVVEQPRQEEVKVKEPEKEPGKPVQPAPSPRPEVSSLPERSGSPGEGLSAADLEDEPLHQSGSGGDSADPLEKVRALIAGPSKSVMSLRSEARKAGIPLPENAKSMSWNDLVAAVQAHLK